MVSGGLAVVADHLHAADHLADGEEAEDLGDDDASGRQLGAVDVAGLLQQGGGLLGGLLGGLGRGGLGLAEERARVLQPLPQGLEVGLEGREGATRLLRDGLVEKRGK